MMIVNKSESAKRSSAPPPIHSEVHLFGQFFINTDESRQKEIIHCLDKNSENPYITHIHLLNERIYSESELGISSTKIIQHDNQGKRLTFQDIMVYIRTQKLLGYFMFANSDILFDETLLNVLESTIHETTRPKEMFALLRYEYNQNDITQSKLFGPKFDAQDTWIFHSSNFVSESQEKVFNIEFGRPGCDNKVAYLLNIIGFTIINDPHFIKTYHFHTSDTRLHMKVNNVNAPYSVVVPPYTHSEPIFANTDVTNITKFEFPLGHVICDFKHNDTLRNYITTKFNKEDNFIIPRISGMENNFAYIGKIRKNVGQTPTVLFKYLEAFTHSMKVNEGIKLSSITSVMKFSELYLDSFKSSEMFSIRESWGEYIKSIKMSHKYILDTYSEGRVMIWCHAMDVFNYIHNTPWTLALRGKRVLIITSFADTVKDKIPIREKIYGIDLFPECEITTMLPPQTQSDNESREFDVELDEFLEKLDGIKETYDVALVSCGGYSNLVCNHIFKTGKSAIYVGSTLPMMFGIVEKCWTQKRKDIIELYENDSWSRIEACEDKRGEFTNVEVGEIDCMKPEVKVDMEMEAKSMTSIL